jgi:hypothetical protein
MLQTTTPVNYFLEQNFNLLPLPYIGAQVITQSHQIIPKINLKQAFEVNNFEPSITGNFSLQTTDN